MKKLRKTGLVVIPGDACPWPHEEKVAKILARAGYRVEFIPKDNNIGSPDVYLEKTRYEIKSPRSNNANTLEHRLKDAVRRQSPNIIFSALRIKNMSDEDVVRFLANRARKQKQIKKLLLITKSEEVVDIKALI